MKKPIVYYRERALKKHSLHLKMGDLFEKVIKESNSWCKLIRDEACGGDQHIPLFVEPKKSRQTEYCNVDLIVLCNNKIRIIVEIEESNIKPTQVCGKFFTAALSKYFIHESTNDEPIKMDEKVTFIQFLDISKLKRGKTSKIEQWKNIENSIKEIIPLKGSKMGAYKIFDLNVTDLDDEEKGNIIKKYILENL